MKKLLLSLAMAACTMFAWGAETDGYNCLRCHLQNGSHMDVVLHEDITITFNDSHLVATSSKATVEVPKSDLSIFEHLYVPGAGINDATEETAANFDGNSIIFSGLPENSSIRVFDLEGRCMKETTVSGSGYISLTDLSQGVYVINVNNKSFKVTLR